MGQGEPLIGLWGRDMERCIAFGSALSAAVVVVVTCSRFWEKMVVMGRIGVGKWWVYK